MKDLVHAPSRDASAGLADLAARVQAATGPDSALDHAIMRACGYRHSWTPTMPGRSRLEWVAEDRPAVGWEKAHVTASLDAALGLVERVLPDWHVLVQGVNAAWFASINPTAGGSRGEFSRNAPTPALALLSALLSALSEAGR